MAFNTITRLAFMIATFVFLTAQADDLLQFSNGVNQSLLSMCQDTVNLNGQFSNIGPNFISSSIITCLSLANNNIENIGNGAFSQLPNLTYLDLSHNSLQSNQLFNFGNHERLKVLIMNYATRAYYNYDSIEFSDYPDLEILSLRGNNIANIHLQNRIPNFDYNSDISGLSFRKQPGTPFPKLKTLDLSENKIENSNFVTLLPNTLDSLDLNANQLSSLALNTKGTNLFLLNLNNNKLKSIVKIKNNYKPLNNPYNNYNEYGPHYYQEMTTAQYGAHQNTEHSLELVSLENLRYLSISRNQINFIESNAFQDTNKLMYLNLSRNDIENLHPDTFAKLQFLTTLDLSANDFTSIPQMSGETNISNLYLSCNKIERIMSNTFVQTPNLIKLLLGGNRISEFDSKAFAYLSILEILDLSKNKLYFLPEGWAKSLISLKQLDLSDNKITLLESLPLANALSLVDVYLAMNQLEYLNPTYFETLPQNVSIKLMQRSSFANWNSFCTFEPIT